MNRADIICAIDRRPRGREAPCDVDAFMHAPNPHSPAPSAPYELGIRITLNLTYGEEDKGHGGPSYSFVVKKARDGKGLNWVTDERQGTHVFWSNNPDDIIDYFIERAQAADAENRLLGSAPF